MGTVWRCFEIAVLDPFQQVAIAGLDRSSAERFVGIAFIEIEHFEIAADGAAHHTNPGAMA